ncbi:MAG: glycerol kinase GlpK [Betaproteobacteria bacterium]|nr:glycerol kinase GlpK [Betaproteobacteria bacterium]
MSFILALDQGTTSSRAIVFDHAGGIKAAAQKEFRQIFPQPGWVEHDPDEIWETQIGVAGEAIARAGIHARDIAAIGITNQRETTVVWDRRTGKPVHNAIVWQDRRTAAFCDELKAQGHERLFSDKTGLVLDAYFSGTKLRWILDHVAGARRQAEAGQLAFGTIESWLAWKLTGGAAHVTDASNASRTLLFDIHRGDWDEELLELLAIPRAVLPEVVPSSGIVAETARGLFPVPIPIAGIGGDQQAALFGQRCIVPGMVKNTYGTGCFMLMHTGGRPVHSRNRLLTTTAWRIDGRDEYALEGSVFIAGASSDVEALAAGARDNGGVYFVPAFAGLGSPHWDPYARGTIVGLTRGAGAAHIARAALESIAYQTADVLHAMESDAGIRLSELRVDGGATQNNFLMQFQADLLGVSVVRPKVFETTALGAAYLAGLGAGYWKDAAEISTQRQTERVFDPAMERAEAARLMEEWRKALTRAKG